MLPNLSIGWLDQPIQILPFRWRWMGRLNRPMEREAILLPQ